MDTTVNEDFGEHIDDRAFMTDYFRRWNEAVIAEVPAEKLLVFQAKDGWEPLCRFLGVPVPSEPYPRVNSREQISERITEGVQQNQTGSPTPEQLAAMSQARMAAMRQQAFPTST
jgi:hypothetical protein